VRGTIPLGTRTTSDVLAIRSGGGGEGATTDLLKHPKSEPGRNSDDPAVTKGVLQHQVTTKASKFDKGLVEFNLLNSIGYFTLRTNRFKI